MTRVIDLMTAVLSEMTRVIATRTATVILKHYLILYCKNTNSISINDIESTGVGNF